MENQEKKEKEIKMPTKANTAIVYGLLGSLLVGTALAVGTHSWAVGILAATGIFLCIGSINTLIEIVITRLSD